MRLKNPINIRQVSSARNRLIAAAIAIATLSIVGGLLATVPSDAVIVPPGQIQVLPYDTYSAYAMYPASGYIDSVQATWTIPKHITCPASGSNPDVGIWVGTWGGTTFINDGTAWQARIGTDSECTEGLLSNSAVWEMPGPVGNKPQTISSVPVHPGDTIIASVTIIGPTANPDSSTPREFALTISDTTDKRLWQGFEWSGGGASMGSIARQAGAVVEGSIPCLFTCGDSPGQWTAYGLAKFSPPIHLRGIYVGASVAAPSWNYFEYVMKTGPNGPQLASNSPLAYHATGTSWSYLVTWGPPP